MSDRLVGQAFTKYTCEECGEEKMWANTGVPDVCPDCDPSKLGKIQWNDCDIDDDNNESTRHNLSGVYFREKNAVTGKYENVCFEELSEENQDKYLKGQTDEWKDGMIKILAKTIVKLGDEFGIFSK